MTNEITIDIPSLIKVEDNSITDPETIRQIALVSMSVTFDKITQRTLLRKIKKGYESFGLYPHVITISVI